MIGKSVNKREKNRKCCIFFLLIRILSIFLFSYQINEYAYECKVTLENNKDFLICFLDTFNDKYAYKKEKIIVYN